MRCPTLAELPPAPPGRTGWPWTIETDPLPPMRPDGTPWPRISIVTPSYNQGQFIEETIRSILLQGYSDLEYVIIDGGSRDATLDVIGRYEPFLSSWVSEADRGQANAINKGFDLVSGHVWQWINSDDLLQPDALKAIGLAYTGDALLAGHVANFGYGFDEEVIENKALTVEGLVCGHHRDTWYHQPGIWFLGKNFRQLGGLREDYTYLFDLHFLIRYLERWPSVRNVDQCLVKFRLHPQSKTITQRRGFKMERMKILNDLSSEDVNSSTLAYCAKSLSIQSWRDYLSALREAKNNRFLTVFQIIVRVLRRPATRLNRFTAGAIKAILSASS